jgi:FkbM family methyltransferase
MPAMLAGQPPNIAVETPRDPMGLLNTVSFIAAHPLNSGQRLKAIRRFAWWQISTRLGSRQRIVPFVNGSRLVVSRGQTGATGNIYTGLHELNEMAFVLHSLRPTDLFVDVGANVGSYTVLAAAAVGARCISFEPDPAAYAALIENLNINGITSRVEASPVAVGATSGQVAFTRGRDTLGHVLQGASLYSAGRVRLIVLDDVLDGRVPALMKIDVEGFEGEVLRGAGRTLTQPGLLAVIMETNGSGARYGSDDERLHETMISAGFSACSYDPFLRKLEASGNRCTDGNTIYVRDIAAAAERVASAPRFDIAGRRSL